VALKLGFASLSLGASVDQQTGSLSVFEVVEEIRAPQVPFSMQSLVISLSLIKNDQSDTRGKVFIHCFTPGGAQQMLGSGDLHVPGDRKRVKAVFRFGGFPVGQFGEHRFVISWTNEAGKKEGEAVFSFDVIQEAQVAQGVPPGEPQGLPN
jgi:hypothetical protein